MGRERRRDWWYRVKIKHDLETILRQQIPIYMMADSKGLFYMITRNSYSSERRLMIDIAAIREAYGKREIEGVAHVLGTNNPADALTKIVHSEALLALIKGSCIPVVSQWVMRGGASNGR